MKRNLAALANTNFDALIIGGGIYGVWTAWDAAQRGLSVALVEKGDFGSATSSNSLKIMHGGLRYLQHADFKRMRESIRERSILMRVAPHLVHPLPCLMPTYGHAMKGREALGIALLMNDVLSFDRNAQLDDPQKQIPGGRIVAASEVQRLVPGVETKNLTGGAQWYDCQTYNTERLLLSILHSAAKAGAEVANYVEAAGFIKEKDRIIGVRAKDVLTGGQLDIRAKITINNSGPWVDRVLNLVNGGYPKRKFLPSKTMNLVVKRQLIPEYAVGVSSKFEFKDKDALISKGSRALFIVPWRNHSLVGTTHVPFEGDASNFKITEEDVHTFMNELNAAYPAAALKHADISFFYGGLLPMAPSNGHHGDVRLVKHYTLCDHQQEDGLAGLVTVVGVKYTTARDVAEKTIALVFKKLGHQPPRCRTHETPVHGGDIRRFEEFVQRETTQRPHGLNAKILKPLVYNYGSAYHEVLKYTDFDADAAQPVAADANVLRAEVLYNIREELAQKLADVIRRRTELGSAGYPGDEAVQACAAIMAAELGWDAAKIQNEIREVKAIYSTA
ncbi:glycerol-3-phosphate dehydrogenase/oxidase [candidate division KSB1 bacterium]|nr:glycerol-3-phosphate dehydrogenase/oxidase [candidate division KSB1 bacterium]